MAQMIAPTWFWPMLADVVLLVHVLFVAFVLFGLVLVLVGGWLRWRWVRDPWFRLSHLIAIVFVAIQTWLDMVCPLTTLEMAWRAGSGGTVYAGSFIGHWLQELLYYQAPNWVFAVCYSVFALAVVTAWVWVRPRSFGRKSALD